MRPIKCRACYFPYFASTFFSMLGVLHSESPEALELPERLKAMEKHFSAEGLSLAETLRQMNFLQLTFGRCGLLLDPPSENDSIAPVPSVSLYPPQAILDWNLLDSGNLRYLLLDESHTFFDPVLKTRIPVQEYRLCALNSNGEYYSLKLSPKEFSIFDLRQDPAEECIPLIMGKPMDCIPFVFANTAGTGTDIHPAPLLPLANIALAIYRGEADYRHALFMQRQSTLFLKGFPLETPPMMDAGNYIHTDSPDASDSFLEISGAGLSEMRNALDDLHERAADLGLLFGNSTAK